MKEFITKIDKRILTGAKVALGVFAVWAILLVGFGVNASSNALNHANLSKNEVSYLRFSFDFDDFIPEYEVSWYIGMTEYEYTVHALSGQLLSMDID